ncbi:MAG TPA: STN domain-containing protein, partial [Pedobacter sp.]
MLITTIVHVSAGTYAQKITIERKKESLEKVFKEIRIQSGYDFIFDAQTIEKAKPVDISIKNAGIEDAVKASLNGQNLSYTIQEHTVIIKES